MLGWGWEEQDPGFGDGGPCSGVRILLTGRKEESPTREEIRTWKKRVGEGSGRSNTGWGQGLN